ncbi:hypothetical protein CK203_051341 [Vitis vinifera]|uniref:Uncharacterized protein n=1 Tax=Vitis vinifera TaxID=29760 RepID=A0A438H489_VITVI|nr:hypothetical protein CK203_051341 [Vitis vinifera]
MKSPEKVARISSYRGVAFEIKPHSDSFAVPTSVVVDGRSGSNRFWLPWNQDNPFRVRSSDSLGRSMSRRSSHFCDLDIDENDFEDDLKDVEEGNIHEEKEQKLVPVSFTSKREQPAKVARQQESRLSIILLDQGLFTVYKQLFMVCLILNIIGLVLAATGHFPYAKRKAALFSIGNILALTLCRSEAFLRVVFWLAVKVLGQSWVPLDSRLLSHPSSNLLDRENTSPEIIGVASTILALLCLSSLAAFPLVRHLHHNVFERTHRFAGWTALALLWAFVLLTISYDPKSKSYSNQLGSRLMKQQEFWSTLAITALIIIPWVTVRRVPVKSQCAFRPCFRYQVRGGVKAGILGRISPFPLSEWHAFGIISDGKTEHMMLAGAVGDFTKSLVSDPPSHLWVRQVHFAGLPYLINMYDKAMMVATGSGICVFLSFLLQPCSADVCLVWVARGIEHNFGREIKEMVNRYPKDKVIVHDTAVSGRPNVAQLSVDAAKNWVLK